MTLIVKILSEDNIEMSMKVLIIDRHVLLRNTLVKYLSTLGGFQFIAGCGEDEEAVVYIEKIKPDVVLVSIDRDKEKGLRLVKEIVKQTSEIKIVAISLNNSPSDAIELLEIGAKGYVTKSSDAIEFANAILAVSLGKTYICPEVAKSSPNEEM